MVLDRLAPDHVDDVLADVRGVVGDPLEVPADEDEIDGPGDRAGILHHVGQELPEDLVVELVDGVVAGADVLGQDVVPADEGVQGVPDHGLSHLGHPGDVDERLELGALEEVHRPLGDVDREVAYPLAIFMAAVMKRRSAAIGWRRARSRRHMSSTSMSLRLTASSRSRTRQASFSSRSLRARTARAICSSARAAISRSFALSSLSSSSKGRSRLDIASPRFLPIGASLSGLGISDKSEEPAGSDFRPALIATAAYLTEG